MRGVALILAASLGCSSVKGPEGEPVEPVEPNLPDIWTKVFVRQCAQSSCHSQKGMRSGLVLAKSSQEEPSDEQFLLACVNLVNQLVQNRRVENEIRVRPGDAQQSFLVKALEGNLSIVSSCQADQECNCPMPFKNDCSQSMPADRILAIRQWIDGMPPDFTCLPSAETGREAAPDASADAPGDGPAD